jgi:Fe-S-cluster containining protein
VSRRETLPSAPLTKVSPVSCANCEAACCRLQVLLIGDNDVPSQMSERSSWGGEVMQRRDDGWCTALDRSTMRCTIYPQRPQICRDFELGSSECLDERVCRSPS